MNWTSLSTRFCKWKAKIKQASESAKGEPATPRSPEWYMGLAVSPASFSEQLGDLQLSLQRVNSGQARAAEAQQVVQRSQQSA